MKKFFSGYVNSFKGLRKEVWYLALITFVNRAGTMVIPFLTKYLNEDLNLSYGQVGGVRVFFGIGSLLGSYLGGKISDKIGFYKVMVISLFLSGILFITLQYIRSFEALCVAILVLMTVADMFRPAMYVSLKTYSKPENRTRSLTLVRLAINLGFALGPALGGLIIVTLGYGGLFWIDGLTCMVAILLFTRLVKEKKTTEEEVDPLVGVSKAKQHIFKDTPFWIQWIISFLITVAFFQLFSTMPLYHKKVYNLSEFHTGLLLAFNGFLVFLFEMPLVSWFGKQKRDITRLLTLSMLFFIPSFAILYYEGWVGILILSVLLMSFGEMFAFPNSNVFVMHRSPKGVEGIYMGYYTMSFSMAHIVSTKFGMTMIDWFGYKANWMIMAAICVLGLFFAIYLEKLIKREKEIA